MEKADAAEYVRDLTHSLAAISRSADLLVLAHLLDMATTHAQEIFQTHDPTQRRRGAALRYYRDRVALTVGVPSE